MIINHAGHHDMSLEPAAHLTVPEGFKWPAAVKKLIAAHDAAWDKWANAELAQLEAQADLDAAPEEDKALLIEAVSAGEPDPGTPTEHAARRAAVYAEEAARQATAKVDELVLKIREALPEHQADLITQACALEREAIAASVVLMTEAQEIAAKANRLRSEVGSRANWLTDMLDLGTSVPHIAGNSEELQWLTPWQLANEPALLALDRLEGNENGTPVSLRENAKSRPASDEDTARLR